MCYDSKLTVVESHRDGASSRGGFSHGPHLEARIAAFLDGRTCGEELLHALYDHILDEPIPPSMRALLTK